METLERSEQNIDLQGLLDTAFLSGSRIDEVRDNLVEIGNEQELEGLRSHKEVMEKVIIPYKLALDSLTG